MSKSIIINEQQVLTCLFKNPQLLESLEFNWFVNPVSKCIYEALNKLHSLNVSFTTSTIVSECAKTNTDVTHTLIEDLKSKVSYELKDFDYYKKRLLEDYVKEDLQGRVLKAATGALISKGELNIELLKQTVSDIENAIDLVEQRNTSLLSFTDILDEYEDALINKSQSNFTSSGNKFVDKYLYGGGLEYGQICSIFGNSGNGKSIATLNLVNGKINRQDPTLYIPTEMGRFSTLDRLIAIRTGLTIDQLTHVDKETDSIPEYVLEEFRREKQRLLKLKYFKLADDSNISRPILQKLIRDMKKELSVDKLTVFIDLGSMMKEFEGDNKASRWEDAINGLFKLAKEETVALVLVFQTKRQDVTVTNYEDCRRFMPRIESLKNSGSLEERSRVVISVFRQKHYGIRLLGENDPEVMLADDVLEMNIVKQNNGPLAQIDFLYDGPTAKMFYYEKEK